MPRYALTIASNSTVSQETIQRRKPDKELESTVAFGQRVANHVEYVAIEGFRPFFGIIVAIHYAFRLVVEGCVTNEWTCTSS